MSPEFRFTTSPAPCVYIPEQINQMSYRLRLEITPEEYAQMLARGWRRFGHQFFRPHCPHCARCRSLRVRVGDFRPGKSQRRVLKKNQDLHLSIEPCSVSPRHIQLYNDYHAFMAVEKGWEYHPISEEDYLGHFVGPRFPFAFDFLYYLGHELVAVGLVDIVGTLGSSIYFYHDPALRPRAPGTFSLLHELQYAQAHGITYHHLGYWVPECASMRYKGDYTPFELLVGYPREDEEPCWVEPKDWQPILNSEVPELIL